MHLLIIALLLSAVVSRQAQSSESIQTDVRGVWRTAVEEIVRSRSVRIVVFNESVGICVRAAQQPCFDLPESGAAAIPADDRNRLLAAQSSKPLAIEGLNLPQVQPMARQELDALYFHFGNPEVFWPEFYARFPGSAGYVLMSAPAFDESRQAAWVLMEHSHLAGGQRLLLFLKRNASAWEIARRVVLWQV